MELTLGVKSGTVGRKLGGGWDLGSTFGIWGLGRMERGAKVNTLLTCLSSHTCHFSTKFQPKFVCILKQIKIRTFGDITSATETTSVLLQTQRQLVCSDSLRKRSLFLDRAKSVLCKKLHGQNCSFSSRVGLLVALRERWAVWSVVRLNVTPQSFLSPGHTTLVQPPITLDQAPPAALRGNKANLVDRFRNVI